jgi:hypothetical protein
MDADIAKEELRQDTFQTTLKVDHGSVYISEFKLLDKIRTEVIQSFVPFNTLSSENRYNFIARGHFRNNELFNPVVRVNEYVNLIYPVKSIDSLFISYYKPLKEIPYPPALLLPEKTIDYPADTVIAMQYSDTMSIMFPEEGVYLCSVDRNSRRLHLFQLW